VVDATPYGKDLLRQLADECHRQDIKLFFYYSQLDWHHPDYYPLGGSGHWDGRPTNGQWPRYLDFMNAQLTELLPTTATSAASGSTACGQARRRLATTRTYAMIHQR
jgi:alpha-L-fucosidase